MTRSFSRVSGFAGALLVAGCIVSGGHPHPLYPGDPRPPAEIARLFGPIGAVDGQDVSHFGKSFSLLPGCHVVKLAQKTGEINTLGSGGYVASLPDVTYAFRMRPAHTYEIEIQTDPSSGPIGEIRIRAWERDANGAANELGPARSTEEIDDCMKWKP
jgi:hypothetical protein